MSTTHDTVLLAPTSIGELVEMVRDTPSLVVHGGRSKPGLSLGHLGATPIDLRGLRGIVEHDPAELTVTARAGTAIGALRDALADHGQYLPFDPPRASDGATLGGTVAAGLSGSGAFRHGSVRDFVIGVTFVDGSGRVVRGGGKVVKNAAGFDLPKLMVGSRGRLGVLTELTFKVFPAPRAHRTLQAITPSFEHARSLCCQVARHDWGLASLDLSPPGTLWLRLAGTRGAIDARAERLSTALSGHGATVTRLDDDVEHQPWLDDAPTRRAPGRSLIRVVTRSDRIAGLEGALPSPDEVPRRYTCASGVGWLQWPHGRPLDELDATLRDAGHAGLNLDRPESPAILGEDSSRPFLSRVARALDPDDRFPRR